MFDDVLAQSSRVFILSVIPVRPTKVRRITSDWPRSRNNLGFLDLASHMGADLVSRKVAVKFERWQCSCGSDARNG